MALKFFLALVCITLCALQGTVADNVVTSLKDVALGTGAPAPCDKTPEQPVAKPPRQFLDQRLPHVVDDYHPPAGGFNPSDIPDKEVDVAARSILREIQAAEAEAKANGDNPAPAGPDGVLTTEEHKALKQLLLDSDILVRAAAKSLAENGPIEEAAVKKVAASAVAKAAGLEKGKGPLKKLAAAAASKPFVPAGFAKKPATPAAKAAGSSTGAAAAKKPAPAAAKATPPPSKATQTPPPKATTPPPAAANKAAAGASGAAAKASSTGAAASATAPKK